jgi:hypothetical protein
VRDLLHPARAGRSQPCVVERLLRHRLDDHFAVAQSSFFAASLVLGDTTEWNRSPRTSATGSRTWPFESPYDCRLFLCLYGTASMLRGYLMARSTYIPRIFGILLMIGGAGFFCVRQPSCSSEIQLSAAAHADGARRNSADVVVSVSRNPTGPDHGFKRVAAPMNFISRLMPREGRFFSLFESHAEFIVDGARALVDVLRDYKNGADREAGLKLMRGSRARSRPRHARDGRAAPQPHSSRPSIATPSTS